MKTAIVILAAGSSSRMGQPKQLLPYRGKPLLRHAVEQALGAACGPVVVVLGSNPTAFEVVLEGLPVEVCVNPRWEEGMGTSIHAGVCAAGDAEAVILTLADQPLLTSAIYSRLWELHLQSSKPVVASSYAGTVGVPVLFHKSRFPALLGLAAGQGCKGLILSAGEDAQLVDCPEAETDVDTVRDYLNLTQNQI